MKTRDSGASIPVLQRYLEDLFNLSDEILRGEIWVKGDDHFGFMAVKFAFKQLTHAKSVRLFLDARQTVDAATISRVMLEGFILLAWASLKSAERPLQSRAYSLIVELECQSKVTQLENEYVGALCDV